jgi:ribosomal protein L9
LPARWWSGAGQRGNSRLCVRVVLARPSRAFHIEKRQIELNEPLKTLGVYRVGVRLHADVKPEIKVWIIKQ